METAERMERFRSLCAANGLSHTHQRQIIFEALSEMRDHPSPEAIYGVVKKKIPSISLATIYKNIKTFVEYGLLAEVSLHHGPTRLEINLDAHHHLVCLRCKAIVDVDDQDVEPVRMKRPAPQGFQVHRYSVEILGICKNCSK